MYYALFLDDYLKTKNYFEYKEVGRAGFSVIIKFDSEPQSEYVELTEDEALAFMFVGLAPDYAKLSVREDNHIWDVLKDRPLDKVPQTNKLGEVLEGLFKYKYTITDTDRENAALLSAKIAKWLPNGEAK